MNWLQIVKELWDRFSAWIEALYKAHAGLATLLGLVIGVLGIYLSWWLTKRNPKTPENGPPLDADLRLRLLSKVQSERVDPRLRQGLREAIRVDLGLTDTPGAVPAKLLMYARLESGAVEERPIKEEVRNIFEQTAAGRLIILGEPGTGKTNLLLELAQSLIADAKRDPARPIPIVFSLSRWTLGKSDRILAEWMKDDLAAEYGLSRTAAEALVQQDRILPLLDGLDEVAQDRRAACVDAIHAYSQGRNLGPLALCCRVAEYTELTTKLDLGAAVRVEKLTRTDVEREIAKPRLEYVRRALQADAELWAVIDTPLWLHVLYGAAQVEWPSGSKKPNIRERLYARYVEYALRRTPDGAPRKRTAREPVLHWLGWLAAEMRRRDQAQFAFEDLDFSWLAPVWTRRAAHGSAVLLVGLVLGLVFGMVFGLVFWWFGGLAVGLTAGLIAGQLGLFGGLTGLVGGLVLGGQIKPMEELRFTWRPAFIWRPVKTAPLRSGRFWLVFALVFGLFNGLVFGLVFGLLNGLSFGLLGWLFGAVQPRPVGGRSAPNRGTLRSMGYALEIALAGSCLGVLLVLAVGQDLPVELGIVMNIVLSASVAGILALEKGGAFALRHYTVRVFLWRSGFAPLAYVRFLNEAAERLFLVRRGGNYEFFHLTFRDYMSDAHGPNLNSP